MRGTSWSISARLLLILLLRRHLFVLTATHAWSILYVSSPICLVPARSLTIVVGQMKLGSRSFRRYIRARRIHQISKVARAQDALAYGSLLFTRPLSDVCTQNTEDVVEDIIVEKVMSCSVRWNILYYGARVHDVVCGMIRRYIRLMQRNSCPESG